MITNDLIIEMSKDLIYNPLTGSIRRRNNMKSTLSTPKGNGYFHGAYKGNTVTAHRAAWALYYGIWPEGEIDHIDGDKGNNSISNLRVVSKSVNCRNRTIRSDNSSGFCGVSFNARRGKWIADAVVDGEKYFLGAFDRRTCAIKARTNFNSMGSFHENHGRPKKGDIEMAFYGIKDTETGKVSIVEAARSNQALEKFLGGRFVVGDMLDVREAAILAAGGAMLMLDEEPAQTQQEPCPVAAFTDGMADCDKAADATLLPPLGSQG